MDFSFAISKKQQNQHYQIPTQIFESLRRVYPQNSFDETQAFNSMIEFEFRQGHFDKAWEVFHKMPSTSVPNVETFKLLFKHIAPSAGQYSNKVKACQIEEAKTVRRPSKTLERAINTFLELDRSLANGTLSFAEVSSIPSLKSDS